MACVQVETGPYPHMILDVRENASTSLPGELRGAVRLALNDLTEVLCSQALWRERFQGIQHPASHYMLILIGNNEQEQSNAAAAAAAAGYQRAMSLAGALPPFSVGVAQPHITFINRDALAVLLGLNGLGMPLATLLDVRRSDERVLYGAIRGSVNVPVDQLASALALPPEQFAEQYRFSKPHPEDLLVMSCRTSTRSLWAGHVAADAGFRRVLVYRQGAYGWRLDPSVKPYRGYAVLDPPPEPEEFTLDIADIAAGRLELQQLGIGVI